MALEFVDSLPAGATGSRSRIYTEEVIEALKDNPNKWAKIPGATQGNAAAFKKKMNGGSDGPFKYRAVNTGKTEKNSKGKEQTVYDIYFTYQP